MIVVNSEALIQYLNEELKSRCSADPQSLTRYVMALLKKKRKEKELRICLLESLEVFLGKETPSFVDLLLEALKSESYVTKSESPADNQVAEHPPGVNEMKKEHSLGVCGDPVKLGKGVRESEKRREDLSTTESSPQGSSSLSVPPPMMSNQRCKAYDQLGYCMAGSSCSYYHGTDALVVEDVHDIIFPPNKNAVIVPHDIILPPPLPPTQSFPLPPLPPEPPHPIYPPTHPVPEAYNPENPGIEDTARGGAHTYSFNTRKRELVVLPTNSTINKERHNTHVKRKAFDYNRLGPKPKFAKTETCSTNAHTIELSNVPPLMNNIVSLNAMFAKFGTITNIEIGEKTSIIRFEKPSQAQVAFKNTPKCNFDICYDGEKRVKTTIEKKEEPLTHTKPLLNFEKKERGKPHSNTHIVFNKSNPKEKALNKKLELLKKKQLLLNARIEYYKVIVEKMSTRNKNKKEEMLFLRDTLKTVATQILNMKTEIKNESLQLRKSLSTDTIPGKKPMYVHSEKALLDAEMDFYHSKSLLRPSKSSEDKKDLLFEVNELKEKAKWLGLFEKEPHKTSNEILERNSLSDEISLTTHTNSVQEEQESTEQSSDVSKSNSLLLGDDEEEDEEEDSEARSWRR